MTPLLLVHAFPLDASMWTAEIGALEGERAVLAPSLPGFGGTAPVGEVLTVEAMAEHLIEELDRAEVERAVVCGCSMGGYAAFELWRRDPSRVAALALVDTRAEPDDDAAREKRRAMVARVGAGGSDAIADDPPPLLSEDAPPDLWERVKEVIRRQPGAAIAAASLGMAERPDSRPILGTIDVPTLVVVGSKDALTPPPLSASMAEAIPHAELVVLEGAGHLSNLEAPQGFLQALGGFLDRLG